MSSDDPRPIGDLIKRARHELYKPDEEREPYWDAEDLAQRREDALRQVRRHAWQDSVPSRFVWAALDDFDSDDANVASAVDWSKGDGSVPNLVVLGALGVGKSYLAVAACRPAHEKGQDIAFWPVTELLDRLDWRRNDSAAFMDDLCQVDRLVIDDIGTERINDWAEERLYLVINRRWLEERPIIATSNLEPAKLAEVLGQRTYSRLVGSGAVVLRLGGEDRRRKRDG